MVHAPPDPLTEAQQDLLALVSAKGTGRAVLLTVDIDDPGAHHMWEVLDESERTDNPFESAWALWASLKEDWPGCTATVVANERADYLRWFALMRQMTADVFENSPEDFVRISTSPPRGAPPWPPRKR